MSMKFSGFSRRKAVPDFPILLSTLSTIMQKNSPKMKIRPPNVVFIFTLARKGPRGTYSHFCISLADQSFMTTMPKMCSSAASILIGWPRAGVSPPTKKAISSSKSMRRQGPKTGGSASSGRVWPFGRWIGVLWKKDTHFNFPLQITSVADSDPVPFRPLDPGSGMG